MRKPSRKYHNLDTRLQKSVTDAIGLGISSEIYSDVSVRFKSFLQKKDYRSLCTMEVNPLSYSDPSAFRDDYLLSELFSKFQDWDLGINRSEAAIEKFHLSEAICEETNNRLFYRSYVKTLNSFTCESYIHTARRKIAALLGPFDWTEASHFFGWGPGASTQVKSSKGDAFYKYGVTRPHVTGQCAVLAACAIAQVPLWAKALSADCFGNSSLHDVELIYDQLEIVEGNRITTVPKNAKCDRVIAIEPTLNMYIQRGIGRCIRNRLRRVGIDLDDQSRNQELARHGSIYGDLCTMDLSMASDSISMELVEDLLPPDWFTAIKQCRSPIGVLPDGSKVIYQKVSSMGNGFTFELESLIFWALVSSVIQYTPEALDRRVSVYGDDLIFSVSAYTRVADLLQVCGFTVNEKKSFCHGYFRESCGKHFFHGRDVTPFYVRSDVNTTERLLLTANNIKRYASRHSFYGCDRRFQSVHDFCKSSLPGWFKKPRIPNGYGDGALIGDFDEVLPMRAPNQIDGWIAYCFNRIPSRKSVDGCALLVKSLARLESLPYTNSNNVRSDFTGGGKALYSDVLLSKGRRSRLAKVLVRQWETLGPWL